MKLNLTVAILLIFPVVLSAQTPDVYFLYGSPGGDADTINLEIESTVEIPVYFQVAGEASIVSPTVGCVLGINNSYITSHDTTSCIYYYPFTEWDMAEFLSLDENYDWDGQYHWDSYSFLGHANFAPPYDGPNLVLRPGDPPLHVLTFSVNTAFLYNPADSVVGNAIGHGENPIWGSSNMGDTIGAYGYDIEERYAHVRFNIDFDLAGAIKGAVTDENLNPISGAYIEIVDLGISDSTDVNGEYLLDSLYTGNYDIVCSAEGYLRESINDIHVQNHDTIVIDIELCAFEFAPDVDIMSFAGGYFDECRWVDTMAAYPDQILEIPIYFFGRDTSIKVDMVHYPLAINNAYFDSFVPDQCVYNYPYFESWCFCDLNEDFITDSLGNTWDSYSFLGEIWGLPPYFEEELLCTYPGDPPVKMITFAVYVRDDIELEDVTVSDAIQPGYSQDQYEGYAWFGGMGLYPFSEYFSMVRFNNLLYTPGDANMINGQWPPLVIGSDVTYLVGYFRAINTSCLLDNFYCAADINGDCNVIGSDVTRFVGYFRGLADISFCPDMPPSWPAPDDIPPVMPSGWPNCE
ncbi:MAG: carboxypeptidase regulatory-like domain-containing protein [candidate division Zixibacteria bacterium]|nr:carboxypeptidase regulatory-like domain-containing protein [candidate division Zixibacteria bacterium]